MNGEPEGVSIELNPIDNRVHVQSPYDEKCVTVIRSYITGHLARYKLSCSHVSNHHTRLSNSLLTATEQLLCTEVPMVRSDPPSRRHLCTPYTLQYPVSKTLNELTAFNSRVGRACMARPLYDRGSTARGDDIRPDVCRDQLKTRLYDVRNSHTVERARAMQNATKSFPSYTVMESATGGCLDTLAACLYGPRHLMRS